MASLAIFSGTFNLDYLQFKVECGSQFSVCLTRSGYVFTWGKGDYHTLGHGSDDHVRRPRKVRVKPFYLLIVIWFPILNTSTN